MNKEKIFKINIAPKKDIQNSHLFEILDPEKLTEEIESDFDDKEYLGKKRAKSKIKRAENRDNIRKKIKCGFFSILVKKINEKIKNNGSILYFAKFPQKFVSDITRKQNKKILTMTLEEIIMTKELYGNGELNNYYHNLNVIKNKDVQALKDIFNKKYCELFEEYINSKEFRDEQINRLKNKKVGNDYIKKYLFLSKHFIEFFSN